MRIQCGVWLHVVEELMVGNVVFPSKLLVMNKGFDLQNFLLLVWINGFACWIFVVLWPC